MNNQETFLLVIILTLTIIWFSSKNKDTFATYDWIPQGNLNFQPASPCNTDHRQNTINCALDKNCQWITTENGAGGYCQAKI